MIEIYGGKNRTETHYRIINYELYQGNCADGEQCENGERTVGEQNENGARTVSDHKQECTKNDKNDQEEYTPFVLFGKSLKRRSRYVFDSC